MVLNYDDVIYMAHPVGGAYRELNIERAKRWFCWLVSSFDDVAIMVPWMPYILTLDESPANRDRGIRDDLRCLRRCDGIVSVGGLMSPGMQGEMDLAYQLNFKWTRDWTWLGAEPPPVIGGVPWRDAHDFALGRALKSAGWIDPTDLGK